MAEGLCLVAGVSYPTECVKSRFGPIAKSQ